MAIKISLAGNPNSGKTTMFNALTGSSQRVGNWPGVTVERKEGRLQKSSDIIIQDLPGIYSLSPYTLEEIVTRDYLISGQPDVIINIVDAANLERNLYLTTQLAELNIPIIIALNMIDAAEKSGISIDLEKLQNNLHCPVIATSAVRGNGCDSAADLAIKTAETPAAPQRIFSEKTAAAIEKIEALLTGIPQASRYWYAVKLFERDNKIAAALKLDDNVTSQIDAIVSAREAEENESSEAIIAAERYNWIAQVTADAVTSKTGNRENFSTRIDSVVTNRFLALPLFAAVMFLVYYLSITTIGSIGTDWVNDVLFGEWIPNWTNAILERSGTAPWLQSLIVDGIIGGVGAVLGFLPQMLVLFCCLAILEDCGYMARVAFIMDRLLRFFGLSGKSFIPMLIGTGCSVPGIMASRTIENESDRRMTVLTTSFIPCGAKLPVIALISGALFNDAAWVVTSVYFAGIAAVVISGIILKKTRMFAGEPSPFIMELPHYHRPLVKSVLRTTFQRGWSFVKKAATIILLSTVIIWFLQNFNWKLEMVSADKSILAMLGGIVAPVFTPLGWGNWRATVATVTGLIAKENIVSTLGVLYGMEEVAENGQEYWAILRSEYSKLAAYSFLLFNLLCAPCFAAVGAIRREMMSARWTIFAIAYLTVFAFTASFLVYQFGMLIIHGVWNWQGLIPAVIASGIILYLLFRKNPYRGKDGKSALDLHEKRLK